MFPRPLQFAGLALLGGARSLPSWEEHKRIVSDRPHLGVLKEEHGGLEACRRGSLANALQNLHSSPSVVLVNSNAHEGLWRCDTSLRHRKGCGLNLWVVGEDGAYAIDEVLVRRLVEGHDLKFALRDHSGRLVTALWRTVLDSDFDHASFGVAENLKYLAFNASHSTSHNDAHVALLPHMGCVGTHSAALSKKNAAPFRERRRS